MRTDRPAWVWIISIVLGLMATSQILILSSVPLWGDSLGIQREAAALSAFDWFSLYALAVILLVSMISFFRLRKRSVDWFIVYIGLGSFGLLRYAAAPESEPHFASSFHSAAC